MGIEIERKYTLKSEDWRKEISRSQRLCQGYLAGNERASVRIRIEGDQANLNIKSATLGIHRKEFEYDIPTTDAEDLLHTLCEQPLIDKIRHSVFFADKHWEIDEFLGENEGLVVAEVELDNENEEVALPDWIDSEVSNDPRYYNVSLVKHPYKNW